MSDDYKVLSFDYYRTNGRDRPPVKIYALKSTSWRSILFPDDLICFFIRSSQLYFNGSLHWLAGDSDDSNYSILTFDMTTELFGEIRLPNHLKFFNHSLGDTLTVVKDSLGVIYDSGPNAMGFRTYKIWVMKGYKNPTSLTMIYDMHCPDTDLWRPLKLRDNGDLITESRRCNLMIYNKESGCYTVDGCEKNEKLWAISIDKFQESLALLDVGSHTLQQKYLQTSL